MGTCQMHCRSPEDCDRSCEDGRVVDDEPISGGTMSTTLDEARGTVAEAMLPRLGPRNAVAWAIARQRAEAIETISRAVFREEMERAETERRRRFEELKRTIGVPVYDEGGGGPEDGEEIARSRAPVGEDERIRALLGDPRDSVSVGPEGPVYHHHEAPTPPAKDTGETRAPNYADMTSPQLLASIAALEARLEELEAGIRAAVTELGDRKYPSTYVIHRLRALTPEAGTARSEDEGE